MTINFYFEQPVTLKQRTRLKIFIGSVFRVEKKKASAITYIFCSDEHLLNMNRQFLKHNYYTDIITFDLSNSKTDPKIADIYISADRVRENARTNSVSLAQELHRVIIHGVLHLCGYKDRSMSQKKIMRSKEEQYLKKYGLLP